MVLFIAWACAMLEWSNCWNSDRFQTIPTLWKSKHWKTIGIQTIQQIRLFLNYAPRSGGMLQKLTNLLECWNAYGFCHCFGLHIVGRVEALESLWFFEISGHRNCRIVWVPVIFQCFGLSLVGIVEGTPKILYKKMEFQQFDTSDNAQAETLNKPYGIQTFQQIRQFLNYAPCSGA